MRQLPVIGGLLMLLALAGLLLAPASSAVAMSGMQAGAMAGMQGMDPSVTGAMPDGMDCSGKDTAPASGCAKDCAFVAPCSNAFAGLAPEPPEALVLAAQKSKPVAGPEQGLMSCSRGPPSRPPKT